MSNSKKQKRPVLVSICAQKGGVGKSACTCILASWLHYHAGLDVAIIDCDYPQYSLYKFREREINRLKSSSSYFNAFKKELETLNKKSYPILKSTVIDGPTVVNELSKEDTDYDIILFDFPGTINTPGVITSLSKMNYLFIPIEADRLVLESEIEFASIMKKVSSDIQIHLFWNRVQRSVKTTLYNDYEKVISEIGLPILKNRLYLAAAFQKEIAETDPKMVFRSTLFPFSRSALRGANLPIEDFLTEIKTIISIH